MNLAQTKMTELEGEEGEFFGTDQVSDGKKGKEEKKFGEGD